MQDLNDNVRSLLNLNKAGRRYLTEDPYSKARGIEVLGSTHVKDGLNALYYHLHENPSLVAACAASTERYKESRSRGNKPTLNNRKRMIIASSHLQAPVLLEEENGPGMMIV
jgi:hypothetical protein